MTKKTHYDDEKHGGPRPGRTRLSEIVGAKIDRELLEPLKPVVPPPTEEEPEQEVETVAGELGELVDPRDQAAMRRAVDHEAIATEQDRLDKTQYIGVRFILRNGRAKFVPYFNLVGIDVIPDEREPRIEVEFVSCTVTIKGRNLEPVMQNLMGFYLADLEEAPDIFGASGPYDTWISSITIEKNE